MRPATIRSLSTHSSPLGLWQRSSARADTHQPPWERAEILNLYRILAPEADPSCGDESPVTAAVAIHPDVDVAERVIDRSQARAKLTESHPASKHDADSGLIAVTID